MAYVALVLRLIVTIYLTYVSASIFFVFGVTEILIQDFLLDGFIYGILYLILALFILGLILLWRKNTKLMGSSILVGAVFVWLFITLLGHGMLNEQILLTSTVGVLLMGLIMMD